MDALAAEGIVISDTLTFIEVRDERSGELVAVNLRGRIRCVDDVVIMVDKWLGVRRGRDNHHEVLGQSYRYHAWQRGRSRRDLVRYDSAHGLTHLHRHEFDAAGRETAIVPLDLQTMPRLDLVIQEAVRLAGRPSTIS